MTRGDDSRALDGALARLLDAQPPELLDQALARDAENARGAALVARREPEHLVDVVHLDLRQGLIEKLRRLRIEETSERTVERA